MTTDYIRCISCTPGTVSPIPVLVAVGNISNCQRQLEYHHQSTVPENIIVQSKTAKVPLTAWSKVTMSCCRVDVYTAVNSGASIAADAVLKHKTGSRY